MLEHLPSAVGRALSGMRAGLPDITYNRHSLGVGTGLLQVASLAFADHGPIPPRYTADGEGDFPGISWTGVPPEAACVVVLVEDADSPSPHPFMHLSLLNLPPCDGAIPEGGLEGGDEEVPATPPGAAPVDNTLPLRFGPTSFFTHRWVPPDPPPGHGPHRYAFQVFALLNSLPADVSKAGLLEAIANTACASGLLIGTYERSDVETQARAPLPA
jgi:phosphatidylethanolamine-binding protein (PEBP) family uncharacterized protein